MIETGKGETVRTPLRVAVLVHSFPKLSETFVVNHVNGLLDNGAEVRIYALNRGDEKKIHDSMKSHDLVQKTSFCVRMPPNIIRKYLQGAGLFLRRVFRNPRITLRSLNAFRFGRQALNLRLLFYSSAFDGRSFDVVHAHFGPVGNIALQMIEIGAIAGPLAVSFHGYDLNRRGVADTNNYKALFQNAAYIFANSEFSRSRLIALGAPPGKIVINPMAVDIELFHGRRAKRDPGQLNLLSVGRLVPEKGLSYALEALRTLRQRFDPDVIFNIIGSGPEESRLKAIAGDAELGKSVVFLGDQSTKEVVHWMARADIFLFPSVRLDTGEVDTQGLALQEAQAMRLPVVASEVGGVPYGLVPGESGFLVRPEDQADLAEKIEHLAARPELRAKMGAAGRAFVCENFSPARFNRIHWRTYREMLYPAGGAG